VIDSFIPDADKSRLVSGDKSNIQPDQPKPNKTMEITDIKTLKKNTP